jgi:hypothetical protein
MYVHTRARKHTHTLTLCEVWQGVFAREELGAAVAGCARVRHTRLAGRVVFWLSDSGQILRKITHERS